MDATRLVRLQLTVHASDIRKQIIKFAVPAYIDFNTSHDPEEVIPITYLKAYMKQYGPVFQTNRDMRAIARQHCVQINDIGASISFNAPDDTRAVQRLGWDMLKTVMIDVHLCEDIQPVVLMAMLAYAPNIEHLYLTTFTDASQLSIPSIWEDEDEVLDFLKQHGVRFVRTFEKLKSIDIDLVCETHITKVAAPLGKFVAEAWMGKTREADTVLMALLRRLLRQVRPTITISAAAESRTFSNDAFC